MLKFIMYCILVLFLIVGCKPSKVIYNDFEITTERKNRITVIGKAENAKGGAIIETEQDSIYYVGKLKDWNQKLLGQMIKISGRLVVITTNNLDETRIVPFINVKPVIKRPIYRIVK
ncbi:hypothetical protein [Brumimicrobium mesophilum]|uniref:hypothetical protein n=1 Tax=Brumimicrobium mesophilum TaxID=392717 RepID=UPI000D1424DF|nr:hypothetical protein [Brumimicrobium mesophilum]